MSEYVNEMTNDGWSRRVERSWSACGGGGAIIHIIFTRSDLTFTSFASWTEYMLETRHYFTYDIGTISSGAHLILKVCDYDINRRLYPENVCSPLVLCGIRTAAERDNGVW